MPRILKGALVFVFASVGCGSSPAATIDGPTDRANMADAAIDALDSGPTSDASDDAADGAPTDAPSFDGAAGETVSLVLPFTSPSGGHVAVFGLRGDGALVDGNVRIDGIDTPSAVAIRSDGREALVTHSAGAAPGRGIAVLSLAPDGSAAQLVQSVSLTTRQALTSIVYINDDEALVTLRGSPPATVQVLHRTSTGWTAGLTAPCGEAPLMVERAAGDGHALVLRTDFIGTGESELVPIGRASDGSWPREGTGLPLARQTIGMAVAPSGDWVFVPEDDPAQPPVNAPGFIARFHRIGDGNWERLTNATIPYSGSELTLHPSGAYGVLLAAHWEMDSSGSFLPRHFRLVTFTVGAGGAIVPDTATPSEIEGSVSEALAISHHNVLVTSVGQRLPSGELIYPVRVHRRDGSGWQQVGPDLLTGGISVSLAVGPTVSTRP